MEKQNKRGIRTTKLEHEPPISEELESDKQGEPEEAPSDLYEVFASGIRVHSKTQVFNEDFTLSDLSMRERWFIREHISLTDTAVRYIHCNAEKKKLKNLLMIDTHSIVIMSRAKEGRMVKGLLDFLIGRRDKEDVVTEEKGVMQKIFSRGAPPQ